MGFMNGRVSFTRFRVLGNNPSPFGPEHLERVELNAIGKRDMGECADGVSVGWAGGDHVLDEAFDLGKNVIDDALHLAVRVDGDKIPSDLLKAYEQMELKARASLNPSGFATKAQKAEAKEAAKMRAEAEATDGRFRRRKHVPVLWDTRTQTLYAGTSSSAIIERILPLFRETFDCFLEPLNAGKLAREVSESNSLERAIDDLGPVPYFGEGNGSVAWSENDPTSLDSLGNEFLVWLWHTIQADGDAIRLTDGSEATVMIAKTLTLDCPRGENGRDNLTDDGPTRLPEAFRALQSGKLPRKAGLLLERHGLAYELTLQAESFSVSGLALPRPEGLSGSELRVARIESLRHVVETLDLLYSSFILRRSGNDWTGELGRIRGWLTAA